MGIKLLCLEVSSMKNHVYFLIREKKVIYIGITICIERRLNEHRVNGKKFDSVRVITVKNRDRAKYYESRWIKRFMPEENKNGFKSFYFKPKMGFKYILLRLPPKLADRVSKTAERESRSLNGQIIYELSANEKE